MFYDACVRRGREGALGWGGEPDGGRGGNNRLDRRQVDGRRRDGDGERLLRDNTRTGIVAQGAAQLVVQDRAARIVTRFKPGRREHHVRARAPRDRTAAESLNRE